MSLWVVPHRPLGWEQFVHKNGVSFVQTKGCKPKLSLHRCIQLVGLIPTPPPNNTKKHLHRDATLPCCGGHLDTTNERLRSDILPRGFSETVLL
jgi:hypothetical protein